MQILIDSFPDDNVRRYVAAIGSTTKARNPQVRILLKPLEGDTDKVSIHRVSLPELDIVRQGSIWKGQAQTKEFYNYKRRVVEETFHINLSEADQTIKTLREVFAEVGYKNFSLPFNKPDGNGKFIYLDLWFKNATYNAIKIGGIEVIISSLETLTATYAPSRKELRRMIMTYSRDDLLQHYLELDNCVYNKDTNECILYPKVSAGDSSFIFLAHLYCDSYVKQVYDNTQMSLEKASLDKSNRPYPDRYPEIKPYHKSELSFSASGIWLDEAKKTFLVLRVNECYAPATLKVRIVETVDKKIRGLADDGLPGENPAGNNTRTITAPNKLKLRTGRSPGKSKRAIYMISEIQSHVNQGTVVRQTDVEFLESDDDEDRNERVNVLVPDLEEINAATGEPVTNPKGIIRQFRTVETASYKVSQLSVVSDVISALRTLAADSDYGLVDLSFLDRYGNQHNAETRISLQSYGSVDDAWVRKNDQIRSVVLMQLSLKNEESFYYIFEIDRVAPSDNFTGLTIKSTEKISAQKINLIIEHVVSQEGRKINVNQLSEKVNQNNYFTVTSFKHKKGGMSWVDKIEGVIADRFGFLRRDD